mmetsp:Transcript_68897/g.150593  ORF Transcript_68897/g.150593 Transcript_68897/m.150593 type:complete len:304 (-) Transcript_68897:2368-3279(-)
MLSGGSQDGVGCGLRGEGELVRRLLSLLHALLLLLDARDGALLAFQLEGGLLPNVLQSGHVALVELLGSDGQDEFHVASRLADFNDLDVLRVEDALGGGQIRTADLVDESRGLPEEVGHEAWALLRLSWEGHRHAATSCEGHLEDRGEQAAVGSVVACSDEAAVQEALRGVEGGLEGRDVHVGGLASTNLAQHLGECGPTESRVAGDAQIREEQDGVSAALEVGGDLDPDIRNRSVGGDHDLSRALGRLCATLRERHAGGHGEGVLATIDSHADFGHHVTECLGSVVHLGTFSLEFRSPHPVA